MISVYLWTSIFLYFSPPCAYIVQIDWYPGLQRVKAFSLWQHTVCCRLVGSYNLKWKYFCITFRFFLIVYFVLVSLQLLNVSMCLNKVWEDYVTVCNVEVLNGEFDTFYPLILLWCCYYGHTTEYFPPCWYLGFLAVHNSSIGDLVTD